MLEEKVERLSLDDLLYLQETLEEVKSLNTSANTLLNFATGRLSKKYSLIPGCNMDQKTGIITRPKPEMVKNDENKESTNESNEKS